MAQNILFTYVQNVDVSNFITTHLNNTTDNYSKRIAFLGETGQIMTHGEIFAINHTDTINKILELIGDETLLDSSTLIDAINELYNHFKLSDDYEMSDFLNTSLTLHPGDTYDTAFGKLEKTIIDNEEIVTNAILYLDHTKLDTSLISTVGLSNDYNDLDNLPIIPSLTGYATETFVNSSINTLKSYIDSSLSNLKTYIDSSVQNLRNYVDSSLALSNIYTMSSSLNTELDLKPGDRFEIAFGKLEKCINDNEYVISQSLIQLNNNKLDSSEISTVGLSNDYNDLDNLPVIPSLTGYATENYVDSSLYLPDNYVMSSSTNSDLILQPGDHFVTAFGKLHKAIIDNETVLIHYLEQLDISIVNILSRLDTLENNS